jgi:putative SOS response-associated peptidase YedK
MCGRYDSLIPRDAMEHLFEAKAGPSSNFPPRYNIAPTQEVPIVKSAREGGGREIAMARWGLVPFYMKALPKVPHINARAEGVDRTGLFREAFAARRCLVPATGFYEWERRGGGKQPYRFRLRSGEPFAFAGLWEYAKIGGEGLLSMTIIVTAANELVARIHDRMPVILAPADYSRWLALGEAGAKELLKPFPSELMESYPVSTIVNHHENDSEECIRPVALGNEGGEQPGLPGL